MRDRFVERQQEISWHVPSMISGNSRVIKIGHFIRGFSLKGKGMKRESTIPRLIPVQRAHSAILLPRMKRLRSGN